MKTKLCRTLCALAAGGLIATATPPADAADYIWTNTAASGSFTKIGRAHV